MNIVLILSSLIYSFFVLQWKVNRDYKTWRSKQPVKHGKSWRLLAFLLLPPIICLAIPITLWGVIITAPFFACWWWILFDGWFNNKRRFNWWHTGSNDAFDAKTDDFLQKLKPWQRKALKMFLPALFTALYVICLL